MLGEIALSIVIGPVAMMLAVACTAYVLRALRTVPNPGDQDTLAGLFKRNTFHTQMREAALLNAKVCAPRCSARGATLDGTRSRDEMLHRIAAVMRGAERDATIIQETAHHLAGEGFIIVYQNASPTAAHEDAEIIPIGDYEEVKLLPPPSAPPEAKAA